MISVIMATFNGEQYIKAQLESILQQSKKVNEIIICDDRSSDNTHDIIENYLKEKDCDFSIIKHNTNTGVLSSFKDALHGAHGDYIFLCDQDDVWLKNKVETMLAALNATNADMAFSNALLVDENLVSKKNDLWNVVSFYPVADGGYRIYEKKELFPELLKHRIVTGMTVAAKREFLQECLPFPEGVWHDEWISLKASVTARIVAVNEVLVLYRQHSSNVIGAGKRRSFIKRFKNGLENHKRNVAQDLKRSELILRLCNDEQADAEAETAMRYLEFHKMRVAAVGKKNIFIFVRAYLKGYYKSFYISPALFCIADIIFTILNF